MIKLANPWPIIISFFATQYIKNVIQNDVRMGFDYRSLRFEDTVLPAVPQPVIPDWASIERSWRLFEKNTVATFGHHVGKVGLLFIPTSGHTGHRP